MDESQIWFAIRDLYAQWIAAVGAVIAASAAIYAAIFAKRAWTSQVRQEQNSFNQFKIAQDQERRALNAADRERRALSPLFEIERIADLREIVLSNDVGSRKPVENLAIWLVDHSRPQFTEICNREQCFRVILKNVRSEITVVGWQARIAGFNDEAMIAIEQLIGPGYFISGRDLFLLTIPAANSNREVEIAIEFETSSGHKDTHTYAMLVCRDGDVCFPMTFFRSDPSTVVHPDRNQRGLTTAIEWLRM